MANLFYSGQIRRTEWDSWNGSRRPSRPATDDMKKSRKPMGQNSEQQGRMEEVH